MSDDLHITLIQTSLHWENREANLDMFSKKIASIHESTDLVLLPEMFTTGFSMHPEQFAETMDGPAMQWMRIQAKEKNVVLCGSMMMHDQGKFFNRLIWMRPNGSLEQYDKRHLFGLGEEHRHYTSGSKKILTALKGWKILPLVCYDLRFPVWSRNTDYYDLLLYVANWPERRITAWDQLLIARAIENQCYVAGVNRVGNDGNSIYHNGDSSVIDPKGEIIVREPDAEKVIRVTLSHKHLQQIREAFPFLEDQDQFEIKI